MPTFLEQLTDAEIKVRFKEPFLTAGMNEKLTGVVPQGIYRGFKLTTHASALTVTVEADATEGDHLAVYTPADGYTLTLRRTTGDFSIDLSSLVSKTVVLALYADYETATDTSAVIRAYEVSPSDEYTIAPELAELVPLGTVVVPASGTIPAANITPGYRKAAWTQVAPEGREGVQLVENGDFELAQYTGASIVVGEVSVSGWDTVKDIDTYLMSANISTTGPHTGTKYLNVVFTGSAGQYYFLPQWHVFQVVPGATLTMEAWVKREGSTGDMPAGNGLAVAFYAADLSGVLWENLIQQPLGNISWTKFKRTVTVPSGAYYAQVSLDFYDVAGVADGSVSFDNVQVWMDRRGIGEDEGDAVADVRSDVHAGMLSLLPNRATTFNSWFERIVRLYQNGITGTAVRIDMKSSRETFDFMLNLIKGGIDIDRNIRALGAELLSEADAATVPRVASGVRDSAGDYTFLWEIGGNLAGAKIRAYAAPNSFTSGTSTLAVTSNAEWYDSGGGAYKWRRDVAGYSARLDLNTIEMEVHTYALGGTSPWDDADWNDGTSGFKSLRAAADSTFGGVLSAAEMTDLRKTTYLGNSLQGSAADVAEARVRLPIPIASSGRYALLFETDPIGASSRHIRVYVTQEDDKPDGAAVLSCPRMCVVMNAYWDGTQWVRQEAGQDSFRYDFTAGQKSTGTNHPAGIYMYTRNSGFSSPWDDDGWLTFSVVGEDYIENMLCADSILKAWAQIECTSTTPTVQTDMNIDISGVSYFGATPYFVDIPFVRAFPSGLNVVAVASIGGTTTVTRVLQVTTTATLARVWATDDTNTPIDLDGTNADIFVMAAGNMSP